jgi:pilus assembly protein CpaB
MSNKKVLLLALICGLLTAVAVNYYLQSIKEAALNIKTKQVVVANARILPNTIVTPEMFTIKNISVEQVHPNAVSDPAQVSGYTARAEIESGEQVLQTKLVPKESYGFTLAYSIPLGYRAISFSINDQTGVGGMINAGDRVDVMGTVEIEIPSTDPNTNSIKKTKTHMILQNVQVLAIGKNYTPQTIQSGDSKNANQNQSAGSANTITLAVPANQMQFIVAVSDKGKLTFALRAPADKSEEIRPSLDALQLLR